MILIVEDNRQVREMIRSIVEDFDAAICECEDGAQALAAYRKHHPDWVLMDLAMREMDGLAATRRIIAAFPNARIVIVTSFDDAELRRAAQLAGACGYVLKEDLSAIRGMFLQHTMQRFLKEQKL